MVQAAMSVGTRRLLILCAAAACLCAVTYVLHFAALVAAFTGAGREFHAVFAYSNGGRVDAALKVFAVDIIMGASVCLVCIVYRYPLPWYAVGIIVGLITAGHWWDIYWYAHAGESFRRSIMPLGFAVPPVIVLAAFTVDRCKRRLGGRA